MYPHMMEIKLGELKSTVLMPCMLGAPLLFVRYMVLVTFDSRLVLEDFRRKGLGEENISCFCKSVFSSSQAEAAFLQAEHGDERSRHS